MYTVKEVSALTNVSIKTLHHYHKIGLLPPGKISEAGYRLYGMKELERLQQILFYRELDFPLDQIREVLEREPERVPLLQTQKQLLLVRLQRLGRLIETIDESIRCAEEGVAMDQEQMFAGFHTEEEWLEALEEQRRYVNDRYGYDIVGDQKIDVQQMNEQAFEAVRFMEAMAQALRDGLAAGHGKVRELIRGHLDFLNANGHSISAVDFAAQCRFFLSDELHRSMMESQQTGLAYYMSAVADAFAADGV